MKTKAIVLEGVRQVGIQELELPSMRPCEILVENEVSAISVGTERWAYIGKRAEIGFPSVLGYMGVGKVIEVGTDAAARGYKVGDRVNFMNSTLPRGCDKTWMGTHLSHALVDVCNDVDWEEGGFNCMRCEVVPENCSPESVALTQLCAVALRGIDMAEIPTGSKVLVNGLGIIGQFAAQICKLKGAYVAASDIKENRLKLASAYQIDLVIDASKEDVLDVASEVTSGKGFDIIIDTASIPAIVNKIFPALRLFGKFVFQGWYPPPSELDLNVFHQRLPTCYFPCAHTGVATGAAIRLVSKGLLDNEKMISHIVKPEQAADMFRMIDEKKEEFLGILFDWRSK